MSDKLNTLHRNLFRESSWPSFVADIYSFNRRLTNLLSSGRLYCDHALHAMSALYGSEKKKRIDEKTSDVYDSRPGYRIMVKVVRNYTQHRGLPIHGVSRPRWVEDVEEGQRKSTVVPYMQPKKLREDPWFEESEERERVLSELEDRGEKVDLRPLVRGYVSGLSEVHAEVRQIIDQDYDEWQSLVESVPERWKEEYGEGEVGVGVAELQDKRMIEEFQTIFADPIERTRALRRRIQENPRLEDLVVTSEEKK